MRHKLCRSFYPWCPGVKNRCLYQTVDARKEEVFFPDVLITLRPHETIILNQKIQMKALHELHCAWPSEPSSYSVIWMISLGYSWIKFREIKASAKWTNCGYFKKEDEVPEYFQGPWQTVYMPRWSFVLSDTFLRMFVNHYGLVLFACLSGRPFKRYAIT